MRGTLVNNLGKVEKNAKVKEGDCIFPFKYKRESHSQCIDTEKGAICATEVNPKTNTMVKYGYCSDPVQKHSKTQKKMKNKKLKLVEVEKGVLVQESKIEAICQRLSNTPKPASEKLKSKTSKTLKSEKKMKTPERKTLKKKGTKLKLVESFDVKSSVSSKRMDETLPKRYNEDFIRLLGKLKDVMMQQGEPFRARAYQKAMESIMLYDKDIENVDQIAKLPGVGAIIKTKLQEFVDTGKIAKLEKEKDNPINALTQVYGIGPKKAKELIDQGITDIKELRRRQNEVLNDVQKIGLEHYEDINARIPRAEIVKYHEALEAIFETSTPKGSHFDIVGSYRRGMADSGDIDIIITSPDDDKTAFNGFLDALIEQKIVTHVLSRGAHKSLTIAKLPGMKHSRRVDFLYTSPKEYPFAILYFTGSKIFNTIMRQRALDMGYSLNEHGLYKMISGKKGAMIQHDFPTEKSIFDFLKMKYKSPEERKDGRAVQDLEASTIIPVKSVKTKTVKKPIKLKSASVDSMTSDFKERGIDALKTLSEKDLSKLLVAAQKAYTNEKPFLTDGQYDVLKEYVDREYPDNEASQLVGAPAVRNKVTLPYNMFSMNKIKMNTAALSQWKQQFRGEEGYEISAKLDGVSGMYSTEGDEPKLYTRGNGVVGQDISHIIPYLNLPTTKGIVVRGEFLIPKEVFTEKYAANFSNARNLVAGIINALKKADVKKYKDLHFVAYEVIVPSLKPSQQMSELESLGFRTVIHQSIPNEELTNDFLSEKLKEWRVYHTYEIDGVIVTENKIHPRQMGNPEHSFAFKMVLSDQVAEAKVLNVLWTPSKDGYLKPRIQIEPVVLGGATIEFATAFNAKFVEDNKLGVGAVVELIRSGDVIPHIKSVITPAEKPQMPPEEYVWNATHVDIMLKDAEDNQIVKEKNILVFFKTLDTDGVGAGNVKKLMEAGFDSIPKILAMTEEDFLKLDGFKKKMANKLYMGIKESVAKSTLPELMAASNLFGRGLGRKRFEPILQAFPDILTADLSKTEMTSMVGKIRGMGASNVEGFVNNVDRFVDFMKESGLQDRLDYKPKAPVGDESDPLYGKEVLMTGFRDKELTKAIEARGGKLGSSVKSDTLALLVKDLDEDTGKALQAKKKGVPIMTVETFKNKYNL